MPSPESYLCGLHSSIRVAFDKLFNSGATLINNIIGDVVGNVTGNITGAVTGNVTGNVTGDVTGEINPMGTALTEHGPGAIGTAFAPRTYRWNAPNGDIITEIHVDLTGLKGAGNTARDVLGLDSGASYIGKYVVGTYGVVYRVEMTCLEVPVGCGTLTDLDLEAEASAALILDGICSDEVVIAGADMAAGAQVTNDAPSLTADRSFYLTEGDTSGDGTVFTAGQYIIRFYGHAVLT